jgi:magnesium-protoporphyrin O-methyltransferase
LLQAQLEESGVLNGDLLDIGCGVGALTFGLLERGIDRATGVDASPAFVAAAIREAERRGQADAVRVLHGDFVRLAPELPPAQLVTLDRVVCCYPDAGALLTAAAEHAKRCVALSYPRQRWYVRLALAFENTLRRLRRNPFRAFAHPARSISQPLESAGFRLASRRETLMWTADVYLHSR